MASLNEAHCDPTDLITSFSVKCLIAYLAKELRLEKIPVHFELVDHCSDGDQFHFGSFFKKSLVKGIIEKHGVVRYVFNFSFGPFFLTSLLSGGGSFGNLFFGLFSTSDRLLTLKITTRTIKDLLKLYN